MKVGHGLPWWIPMDLYLSTDETRAMGERRIGIPGRCTFDFRHPGEWVPWSEGAHIVRRMAGGRQDDLSLGPCLLLCQPCHTWLDGTRYASLAMSRADESVHLLELVEDEAGDVFDRGVMYRIKSRIVAA